MAHVPKVNTELVVSAVVAIVVLGAIAAACILVPSFAQWPLDEVDWSSIQAPPSAEHLLGTDGNGRDLLVRIFYGGRI